MEFGHAGSAFEPTNAGIAVLETNRVFGGDSWFAYTGKFEVGAGGITGTLKVQRYHKDNFSIDAWETGEDTFDVEFAVNWVADAVAEGTMTRNDAPLGLRLRKLAELP